MPDSTEQLQDIEDLDSRVDALMKEIDAAGADLENPSTAAARVPSAGVANGAATTSAAAAPKPAPAAHQAAPTSAPDSLLSSVSDEIETVAPGPLAPPPPPPPSSPPSASAAAESVVADAESEATEPEPAGAVDTASEPPLIDAEASPTPGASDARVDALIDTIGADLAEQASRAESVPADFPPPADAEFLSPEALPAPAASAAPASPRLSPQAHRNIDDLDAALAENAEQAIDEAVQESAPKTVPAPTQAVSASAAGASPAPTTHAAARSDTPAASAAASSPQRLKADSPAPVPSTTAADAATTAPAQSETHQAAPSQPGPGVGTRIAAGLLRPLGPIARLTERMPEQARQALAYVAVMTMFFAAVTWAIVLVKKPPANEPLDAGFPFVKQDDPPVAPRPKPAQADAEERGAAKKEEAHGESEHGAKKKDDPHAATKRGAEAKPDAKKDSHASAAKPKKPAGTAHASAEHD